MDKQGNLRLIVALAVSFAIIFIWSKFFQNEHTNQSQITKSKSIQDEKTKNESISNDKQAQDKDVPINAKEAQNNNISQNANANDESSIIATIESKNFDMQIDNLGRIKQVFLKEDKYTQPKQEGLFTHIGRLFGLAKDKEEKLKGLALFDTNQGSYPLEIRFANDELNKEAFTTKYSANTSHVVIENDAKQVVLTQNLRDLVVQKIITIRPDSTYSLDIKLSKAQSYVLSNGMRPVADGDNYAFNGVLIKTNDNKIEKIEDKDARIEGENFSNIKFIASVDRYYTTLFYSKDGIKSATVGAYGDKKYPIPFININSKDIALEGYIGPKEYAILKGIHQDLTSVVEYGIITFFAKYVFLLLDILHKHVGNWGFAIILLVVIIRIILFPLTFKGMVSMQKLKDLAPKMKELQAKHKGEPQKLQAAMMDLYKKNGANPLGGCLPLLLQIPVFFAIYRVLYNAVELKYASFLFWIHDLSVMDPYFALPILMGISMYLQQNLTPTTMTDPMQQKLFKFLPVIFTLFLITFPAGLTLYWTVNNIFSILQQLTINKMLDVKKQKIIAAKKHHEKM